MFFDAIPAQLEKMLPDIHASPVIGNVGEARMLEMMAEMKESRMFLTAYHASDPGEGLMCDVVEVLRNYGILLHCLIFADNLL